MLLQCLQLLRTLSPPLSITTSAFKLDTSKRIRPKNQSTNRHRPRDNRLGLATLRRSGSRESRSQADQMERVGRAIGAKQRGETDQRLRAGWRKSVRESGGEAWVSGYQGEEEGICGLDQGWRKE